MIKYICDLCGGEIKQGEENGTLVYVEKTFMFDVKHQKQDAVKETKLMFCSQCLKGIKDYISGQMGILNKK